MPVSDLPPGFDPFDLAPIATPHSELVADFFASTASLAQSEIDYLVSRDVPPLALCNDPGEDGWAVGRAFIIIDDSDLFEFAAEGAEGAVKALCVVGRDVSGWPIDIVAWYPKADRVVAHLGRVTLLGEHRVNVFRFDDEPLAVHRSMLGWLRNERRGVVILDERRAWRVLEGVEVVAEDFEHGRQLQKILEGPRPRILIPEAA